MKMKQRYFKEFENLFSMIRRSHLILGLLNAQEMDWKIGPGMASISGRKARYMSPTILNYVKAYFIFITILVWVATVDPRPL